MLLQIKIYFFCLSMVLIPETAHSSKVPSKNTPDLAIEKCNSTDIKMIANKAGSYYTYDKQSSPKYSFLISVVKPISQSFDIKTAASSVTIIRVDAKNLFTKGYDMYSVDRCSAVTKVTVSGSLDVGSGIPKSIGVTFNPHAAVTFELGGKEVKNVNLGDSVTMVIKSDNVQEVKVLNCTASEGTKNTLMFFPANKPSTSIVVSETDGNPAKVEFEAFRFISQKNDELTIKCDVALCPEKANCKLPNPSSPVLYEVAPGVKRKNFEGVLAVYLPQDPMVNTAVKVSSYAKGLLLTLGAVFLQRQLV